MTLDSGIVIEQIGYALGENVIDNGTIVDDKIIAATGFRRHCVVQEGVSLVDLAFDAAKDLDLSSVKGVVAATFSGAQRFPALSIEVAGRLGLDGALPALDVQMACSAYPYALYVAHSFARDLGGKILILNGDVQSPFVDKNDKNTAPLFSDAATATVMSAKKGASSRFEFFSKYDTALQCPSNGPVKMDGFKVFEFVANEVSSLLKKFDGESFDYFVPHQANMYMTRQLARSIGAEEKLLRGNPDFANPGSCSIALTLANAKKRGKMLLAGFGAGLSAVAVTVEVR